jgi:hypothetical protein
VGANYLELVKLAAALIWMRSQDRPLSPPDAIGAIALAPPIVDTSKHRFLLTQNRQPRAIAPVRGAP